MILIIAEWYKSSHLFMMISIAMNAVYDSRIPGKGLAAKVTWREVRNMILAFTAIAVLIIIVYIGQDFLMKHVEYMKGFISGVVMSITVYVVVKKVRSEKHGGTVVSDNIQ